MIGGDCARPSGSGGKVSLFEPASPEAAQTLKLSTDLLWHHGQ
jgi:hypothetical protein